MSDLASAERIGAGPGEPEVTRLEGRAGPARSAGPAPAALDVPFAAHAAGNRAAARLAEAPTVRPPVRPARRPGGAVLRLAVTAVSDPVEREAERVARAVDAGSVGPAATGPAAPEPAGTESVAAELARSAAPGPAAAVGPGGADEVPPDVAAVLASPGGGAPLSGGVLAAVEPVLGADLSGVRVHTDAPAADAATRLGARAFTHAADVFLGPGESATDVALMAHEATHVVQQGAAGASTGVARAITGGSAIPDVIMDGIRAIPGYRLVCLIAGEDPITGAAVGTSREDLVELLLGYGPFSAAVGPVLRGLDVLDGIMALVTGRMAEFNLTGARVASDIARAWDEMHFVDGIDVNVAIARRYVAAIVADVRACVAALVNDLIAAVRRAAVAFAQPLVGEAPIGPYWHLGVEVFGYDPLADQAVSVPTETILADFLHLVGQDEALQQMRERGTLAATAAWLDTQLATFAVIKASAVALFADAWAAISPETLPTLLPTLRDLAQRAFALLQQVAAFATTLLAKVVELVKHALLGWASGEAHKLPGYDLLTVILGADPITDQPVPRTPENLIRGFIVLLPGGEATYAQLAASGVIAQAATRIETAMTQLGISWELITGTFAAIWDALSLADLLNPIEAITRVVGQFADPLSRIVAFAAEVIKVVVELILTVMNFPSDLLGSIVGNAMAAIDDIKADPLAFLDNLILALKQGLSGFFDNIGTHLLHGLADWLFRGLRGLGIEPPAALDLQSVITLVLQVLGLSMDTVWTLLGEKIGAENVARLRSMIDRAGQAWAFVADVQERGITAIWEYLQGQLSNLWDLILTKAKDWIMEQIISKVTTKLLSMLDPTGVMAVINSCVAFFNAVQSAIEYLRDILAIVDRYVSTIAAIAKGNVAPGAQMLEAGLADAVPVAIGFLANQVGLGNVPEQIAMIITDLRELVMNALRWLVDQAWSLGEAALRALGVGGAEPGPDPAAAGADASAAAFAVPAAPFSMEGTGHTLSMTESGGRVHVIMASAPGGLIDKIDRASAAGVPAGAVTELAGIRGELVGLEADASETLALYRQPGNEGLELVCAAIDGQPRRMAAFLLALSQLLVSYSLRLAEIGARHHITDLLNPGHPSRYVEGNVLKAEYRSGWRQTFYGGFVGGAGAAVRSQAFGAGVTRWSQDHPAAPGTAVVLPSGLDLYQCAWCGEWFSSAGGAPGYEVRQLQVDHDQTVVQHWLAIGRNTDQAARTDWNSDVTNLQPLCRTCNGGGNPTLQGDYTVGDGFRGPNDVG